MDAALFKPDPACRPAAGGAVTIVALSRLVYRKGIDLLAAVLPELCRRHPHVNVVIGGDGPKRGVLEAAIAREGLEGRVSLLGAVPPDQVRGVLVRGQVFLNTSLTEAFCMALVEAAAAGLLVVSTRVGGVPEVLPEDLLILADPSPDGVLRAVEAALARLPQADPWAAHAAVAGMYSWPSVGQRTETVYRGVLAEQAGSGRDDGLSARLGRYARCGKWFGKICCCVAAVDWMYWRALEWWAPRASFLPEPDFPYPLPLE